MRNASPLRVERRGIFQFGRWLLVIPGPIDSRNMSEDESNVEKKEEEKEAEQDAEATEGDAEDAKDEAPEPPKKRASRMSVPKAAKSPKKG